ncbi:hypothetical protein ACP4OV_013013 [Aristida adscensionis]
MQLRGSTSTTQLAVRCESTAGSTLCWPRHQQRRRTVRPKRSTHTSRKSLSRRPNSPQNAPKPNTVGRSYHRPRRQRGRRIHTPRRRPAYFYLLLRPPAPPDRPRARHASTTHLLGISNRDEPAGAIASRVRRHMLSLHPRLVRSGGAGGDVDEDGRVCYCVAVSCVSLLLFILLAAAVSVAKAAAITGAVVLTLGLVAWFAPTAPAPQQQPQVHAAAAAPPVRLVPHRCACGLTDAAIGALPAFAYAPPAAAKGGAGGDGSSVLCAVCLEDVRAGEMVRRLPACAHLFHVDCVDAWLRSHRTCPLCRRALSPAKPAAKAAAAVAAATATVSSTDVLPPV